MFLEQLHHGILVPEYSLSVPWLVSPRSLYRYIPRKHFRFSPAGWPLLRFTCLGINAEFGFNFVSHPEGRLVSLQMIVDDSPISTRDGVPTQLLDALGRPNRNETNYFRWFDDQIVVDCCVCVRRRNPEDPFVYEYSKIEICYSASWLGHWATGAPLLIVEPHMD